MTFAEEPRTYKEDPTQVGKHATGLVKEPLTMEQYKAKADLDLKVRLVQIGAPISKGNALAALCDTATAMIADDGGLAFAKVITL